MPSTWGDSGTGLYRCNRRATKQTVYDSHMRNLKQKKLDEDKAWSTLKNVVAKRKSKDE